MSHTFAQRNIERKKQEPRNKGTNSHQLVSCNAETCAPVLLMLLLPLPLLLLLLLLLLLRPPLLALPLLLLPLPNPAWHCYVSDSHAFSRICKTFTSNPDPQPSLSWNARKSKKRALHKQDIKTSKHARQTSYLRSLPLGQTQCKATKKRLIPPHSPSLPTLPVLHLETSHPLIDADPRSTAIACAGVLGFLALLRAFILGVACSLAVSAETMAAWAWYGGFRPKGGVIFITPPTFGEINYLELK